MPHNTDSQRHLPDLTICDREPITKLDLIQDFGFLVAMSNDWTIARVSSNVTKYLGADPDQLIGTRLQGWISEQAIHEIRNRTTILFLTGSERIFGVKLLKGKKAAFDLCLHFANDLLVIEGEPAQADGRMEAASMVRAMFARLATAGELDAFHRDAARQVRALTGFDRVMIYRFDQAGAGEVIAESTKSDTESFLGLRYPASDIPVQARALYLRNPFRIIADVASAPVSLCPEPHGAVQPLDLSMAVTRAVSPVHIEYLTNMGIGASLSISIIVGGQLWGLIACHHRVARLPSFVMRTATELFGQMYSMTLEARLHKEAGAEEQRARDVADRMIMAIAADNDLLVNAQWIQDVSRDIITCDGVAICNSGEVFASGATPPPSDVRLLAQALSAASPSQVFATDHLASMHAGCESSADRAAGMLSIPISRVPRDYVMLFRRERIQEVKWAGEPAKTLTVSEDGKRLSPRKSFAAFMEQIRGHATPFSLRDLRVGEAIRLALIEVNFRFSETAGVERKAETQRQDLLIAELNHRVRNILALVRGLISQTGRSATDVSAFVDGLNGRVQALARAHDQITRQDWGPGSVTALFDDEIAAYCPDGPRRFVFDGPPVLLQPRAITTLALVIHELVTNSVKHGALSTTGVVHVTVEAVEGDGVWLRWRERGGPAVQAPVRRGFGSVIIERSVPFDLLGSADVRFLTAGLEADFFIPHQYVCHAQPATAITVPGLPEAGAILAPAEAQADRPLLGLNVLLVEDNMLIALEAEAMLTSLGAAGVVTVSTLDAAEDSAVAGRFDFAMLDVSIGPGTSFDLATRLRHQGIPYIFASGYGNQIALDAGHSSAVVVQKPYDREHLRRAIRRVNAIADEAQVAD
jgi:light-regulated signal transduction histidine kinase (bacteriophytochrome)